MPQDPPADTAGPSSPPPRMPEGWLPQWEGVQRKWYYVQRATGKSQWEIPTEPVVLTPSTTPTSIGTGPSQAPPSRPSTNSPQVTGLRGTMAERIEDAAGSARNPSSLNSQVNGQPGNTGHGYSGPTNWYPEQNGAPGVGAYGSGQNHGSSGNMVIGSSNYYPHNFHSNQIMPQQPFAGNSWAIASNVPTGQASGFNPQHYHSHSAHYENQPVNISDGQALSTGNLHPPQPQWRVETEQPHPTAQHQPVSQNPGSSNSSQPYFSPNPASQVSDWPRRDIQPNPSQSYNSSLPGSDYNASDTGQHKPPVPFPMYFQTPVNNAQSTTGFQMSRSHSHQAALPQQLGHGPGSGGGTPSHEYSQQAAHMSGQYGSNMTRSHSGTAFNSMVFPPGPDPQNNAQYYQNPLAQAGMPQYTPHQQPNRPVSNMLPHEFYQNSQPASQQHQWQNADPRLSRAAASDPQFISGPWGSTPPT